MRILVPKLIYVLLCIPFSVIAQEIESTPQDPSNDLSTTHAYYAKLELRQKKMFIASMEKKDPYVGVLCAAAFPGGGQIYVREFPTWPIVLQVLVPIASISAAVAQNYEGSSEAFAYIGIGTAVVSKCYDIWVAPKKVKAYNNSLVEQAMSD